MSSPHDEVRNSASSVENVVQAQNVHGDVHVHSSAESRTVPRQLPATVRHFINRTVEQDALTTLLRGAGDDDTVLVSTVDGLAGVGKSTLVVQWAHRVREQFADGELHVNLRGFDPAAEPMAPAEALAAFLSALGVAPEAMPAGEQERAAQFRTLLHGRRMLLVLDNARDTEQVRPLLPASPGCLVVVTSRQRLDGLVAHHGAQRLTLATLTREEARGLLERHVGADRMAAEPGAVAALLEHCAGLPLALTLVAVQAAAEPDVPLDDLAADLRDERERLDALDAAGTTGIRAVFSWSYRALSPEAARLFRLLGLSNSPDIGLWAASALAGTEQRRVRRALAELCRAHLLNRRSADRYVFHDLLRAYARERAHRDDTEHERTAALQRLLDHHLYTAYAANQQLGRDLPALDYTDEALHRDFAGRDEALAWWDAERSCFLATVRQAMMLEMVRGPWLIHAAMLPLKLRGVVEVDEWEAAIGEGIVLTQKFGDRAMEARLGAALATVSLFSGRPADALPHLRDSNELFEEIGEYDWVAGGHATSGEICLGLGRYEEAVDWARKALGLLEQHGPVRELEGQANSVLGLALVHLDDFEEGFARLHRAIGSSEGVLDTSLVTANLGAAYFLAGDTENAVRTYRQVVEQNRADGNKLGEARGLDKLADVLNVTNDSAEARKTWDASARPLRGAGAPQCRGRPQSPQCAGWRMHGVVTGGPALRPSLLVQGAEELRECPGREG